MTSLNMPGFSLSLLLLPSGSSEPYSSMQILELLDAPANAPGWAWTSNKEPGVVGAKAKQEVATTKGKEVDMARQCFSSRRERRGFSLIRTAADSKDFLAAITRSCKALIEAEPELTEQDQIAGDGDAGLTLKAGAKAILKAIDNGKLKGRNVIEDIGVIAEVVEEDMGGTSGALYSSVRVSPQASRPDLDVNPDNM